MILAFAPWRMRILYIVVWLLCVVDGHKSLIMLVMFGDDIAYSYYIKVLSP